MPRYVDHDSRRRSILDAALQIMANEGAAGLSFRRIAEMVGGNSTSFVTHYYATQRELIDDLHVRLTAEWETEIASLGSIEDEPRERLRQLLLWFIPDTEVDVHLERARIQLLARGELDDQFREAYHRWNAAMKVHLEERLSPLVDIGELDGLVDVVRIFTRGMVLSMLENPAGWDQERRTAAVDRVVQLVDSRSETEFAPAPR